LRASELFQRSLGNPNLTAEDWPYTANAVFNPGVTRFDAEACIARSPDGLTDWTIDADRRLLPDFVSEPERFGIEDPRKLITGSQAPSETGVSRRHADHRFHPPAGGRHGHGQLIKTSTSTARSEILVLTGHLSNPPDPLRRLLSLAVQRAE